MYTIHLFIDHKTKFIIVLVTLNLLQNFILKSYIIFDRLLQWILGNTSASRHICLSVPVEGDRSHERNPIPPQYPRESRFSQFDISRVTVRSSTRCDSGAA